MTINPMIMKPTTTTLKQFNAEPADWAKMPLVITVKEMAQVLGIGRRKAYELVEEPGFPRVKLGGIYRVNTDGLRQYLESPGTYGMESHKKIHGGISQ